LILELVADSTAFRATNSRINFCTVVAAGTFSIGSYAEDRVRRAAGLGGSPPAKSSRYDVPSSPVRTYVAETHRSSATSGHLDPYVEVSPNTPEEIHK
jgi:hypothetical protein